MHFARLSTAARQIVSFTKGNVLQVRNELATRSTQLDYVNSVLAATRQELAHKAVELVTLERRVASASAADRDFQALTAELDKPRKQARALEQEKSSIQHGYDDVKTCLDASRREHPQDLSSISVLKDGIHAVTQRLRKRPARCMLRALVPSRM
jgi:hypothetical protein